MLQSEARKEDSQKTPVSWFNLVAMPRCDCTALSSNRRIMLSFSCLLQACTESDEIWFVCCLISTLMCRWQQQPEQDNCTTSHVLWVVWFSRDAALQTLGFIISDMRMVFSQILQHFMTKKNSCNLKSLAWSLSVDLLAEACLTSSVQLTEFHYIQNIYDMEMCY